MRYMKVHYKFQIRPICFCLPGFVFVTVCVCECAHLSVLSFHCAFYVQFVSCCCSPLLVKIMAEYVLFKQIFFCFFDIDIGFFFACSDFYYPKILVQKTRAWTSVADFVNQGKCTFVVMVTSSIVTTVRTTRKFFLYDLLKYKKCNLICSRKYKKKTKQKNKCLAKK